MDNANLYDLFRSRFAADLDAPFLENEDGRRLTYGDLDAETGRIANLLAARGVRPGERVAVQVDKSPEALLLYLACLRTGAVYLPLNTAYQRAELEYFIGDASPRLVVCRPGVRDMVEEVAAGAGCSVVLDLDDNGRGSLMEEASRHPAEFATVPRAPDDLAAILYTSGTTGRSKGAMLSHRNLASNALVLHGYWGWKKGDVLLHALPIFHAHGLFVACHCALLNASPMLWLKKFDSRQVLRFLPRATVFMGVPTFYTRLLETAELDRQSCANMRLFISGSAPLLAETHREFTERTGHVILERYGMTETIMLTSNPLDGERRAGTVGFPLPGVAVRIADEQGRPLAAGEVGHVQVKGDSVFGGYWRMPEKTREEFTADGFFKTGDLGVIAPDGYITLVGRSKDLIISGGYNVYPKEIESYLDELPGVAESAVIGVPHRDFGEAVAAVIVPDGSSSRLDEDSIIALMKERVAGFKVPKRVIFVDQLPRNAMGKVQKNLLREQFMEVAP